MDGEETFLFLFNRRDREPNPDSNFMQHTFTPLPAKVSIFNLHPLEVVSLYSVPQRQANDIITHIYLKLLLGMIIFNFVNFETLIYMNLYNLLILNKKQKCKKKQC